MHYNNHVNVSKKYVSPSRGPATPLLSRYSSQLSHGSPINVQRWRGLVVARLCHREAGGGDAGWCSRRVCVRKVVVVVTRPRRGEAGVGGGDVSASLLGAEVGGDASASLGGR